VVLEECCKFDQACQHRYRFDARAACLPTANDRNYLPWLGPHRAGRAAGRRLAAAGWL